jgi:hypothetical protein
VKKYSSQMPTFTISSQRTPGGKEPLGEKLRV